MNSDNNPEHVTVVKQSGASTMLIAVLAILALAVTAWFVLGQNNTIDPTDAKVSAAADKVGAAADKVGDAAQEAVKKN